MGTAANAFGVAAFFAMLNSPVCALVITPMDVFADCIKAKDFRDKELPKKLEVEFQRYRKGVQARVDEVATDFAASIRKSKIDYAKYSEAQKKEVLIASGKFLSGLMLERFTKNMKGPWKDSYDKLPNNHKDIVDAIGTKTKGFGELTFDAVRGKQPDTADIIKPYVEGLIELLPLSIGPVGTFVIEGAKGTIEIGGAYLEHKPDKDFAEQQIEFWKKSLDKLIVNSPEFRTRVINDTKKAIDKACGA